LVNALTARHGALPCGRVVVVTNILNTTPPPVAVYKVISACNAQGVNTLATVPSTSNLYAYVRQISTILLQARQRSESPAPFIHKLCHAMFDQSIDVKYGPMAGHNACS
jgi:hypothetical protein